VPLAYKLTEFSVTGENEARLEDVKVQAYCAGIVCATGTRIASGLYELVYPSHVSQFRIEKEGYWSWEKSSIESQLVGSSRVSSQSVRLLPNLQNAVFGKVILRTDIDQTTYVDEPLKNVKFEYIQTVKQDTLTLQTDSLGRWKYLPTFADQPIIRVWWKNKAYTQAAGSGDPLIIPRAARVTGTFSIPNTSLASPKIYSGVILDSASLQKVATVQVYTQNSAPTSGTWVAEDIPQGAYIVRISNGDFAGQIDFRVNYNFKLEKYLQVNVAELVLADQVAKSRLFLTDSVQPISGKIWTDFPIAQWNNSGDTLTGSAGTWILSTKPTSLQLVGLFESRVTLDSLADVDTLFLAHPISKMRDTLNYDPTVQNIIYYKTKIIPDSVEFFVSSGLGKIQKFNSRMSNDSMIFDVPSGLEYSNSGELKSWIRVKKGAFVWSDIQNPMKIVLPVQATSKSIQFWTSLSDTTFILNHDTVSIEVSRNLALIDAAQKIALPQITFDSTRYIKIREKKLVFASDSLTEAYSFQFLHYGDLEKSQFVMTWGLDSLTKYIRPLKISPSQMELGADLSGRQKFAQNWISLVAWGKSTKSSQKVLVRPKWTWSDTTHIHRVGDVLILDSLYAGTINLRADWRGLSSQTQIPVAVRWNGKSQTYYVDSLTNWVLSDSLLFVKSPATLWLNQSADWSEAPYQGQNPPVAWGPWSQNIQASYPIYKRPRLKRSQVLEKAAELLIFNQKQQSWQRGDSLQIDSVTYYPPAFPQFLVGLGSSKVGAEIEFSALPNPFSPKVIAQRDGLQELGCRLRLSMGQNQNRYWVTLEIRNLLGELVRVLEPGKVVQGTNADWFWDGLSDQKRQVRNGRYRVLVKVLDPYSQKEVKSFQKDVVVFE
jgi:hypothetical protein